MRDLYLRSKRLLRRGDTEVLLPLVLEVCVASVARQRTYYIVTESILAYVLSEVRALDPADAIPLAPDPLALRATIGLINPLGLALLVGCLPLPLSLRRTTTRAFSGYRAVLCTGPLRIPVIDLLVFYRTRHVFCFHRWNGMKVVGEYEFGRVL